jgi:hypothetical protein
MTSSVRLHSERFQSKRSAPDSVQLRGPDQPAIRSGQWPTYQPLSARLNGLTVGEFGPITISPDAPHGPVLLGAEKSPPKGFNGSICLEAYLYPHARPNEVCESPRNWYMS